MRNLWLAAAIAAASTVAIATPASSMGGGGYSGGGGGGSLPRAESPGSQDDYSVAVRLIKHEKYAEAIPHLQLALADKPHDADVLNYLGYTNRMIGKYPASLDYYKRALAIDPSHRGVHEYLGELYLQMNDAASAQHELDTLASLCPSGCEERDTLTKAIAAHADAAPNGPAGAAAPATTDK